jgi:hypothetical protein
MFYKCFVISAVSTTPARKSKKSLQDSCVFYLQGFKLGMVYVQCGRAEDFAPKPLSYYNTCAFHAREERASTHCPKSKERKFNSDVPGFTRYNIKLQPAENEPSTV